MTSKMNKVMTMYKMNKMMHMLGNKTKMMHDVMNTGGVLNTHSLRWVREPDKVSTCQAAWQNM